MKNRGRGFTLMEVTLVVALISTIAYLSYGSLRELRRGFAIDTVTREFTTVCSLARSAAIRSGNTTSVEFSRRHMVAFHDLDASGSFEEDSDRRLSAPPSMPLFLGISAKEGENIIRFNSQGYSVNEAGDPIEVNVAVYDDSPRYTSSKRHQVDVLVSGAVRVVPLVD